MIESDEEIRKVQAELRKRASAPRADADQIIEKAYRPTTRVPVIALVACDDGKETGELFRIRRDQFMIGRTEGDFQLPHDEAVSSRHVAITRQKIGGERRVAVTDLQSRNGLYVRASKAPLPDGAEFLIGRGHYRIEIVRDCVPATADMQMGSAPQPFSTRLLEGNPVPGSVILSEIVNGRAETKIRLDNRRYMIGRDERSDITRPGDEFTAGQHALLTRSDKGTWVIENQKTLNGIWLKMSQVIVGEGKSCEFRIGEQRFRLKFGVTKT